MSTMKCRVGIYAALHFLMDFSCAVFMTGTLLKSGADPGAVLVYNFAAFALQFPIGALLDAYGISSGAAAASFFIFAGALVLRNVPYAAAAAAGIGNSLFHTGAGRDLLVRDREHCALLGIFISPGAVGIFAGTLAGAAGVLPLWILALLAAAGAFFAWYVRKLPDRVSGQLPERNGKGNPTGTAILPLLCLLAVVILRSYMGAHQEFAWKTAFSDSVCVLAALVLGKAFGGVFADRIGKLRFSCLSLAAAAVFFLFSGISVFALAAVFLFNMTMPVTMRGAAEWLPGREGTSFGFLSFGLFIGYFADRYLLSGAVPFAGFSAEACLISLVFLALGLKRRKEI
jgi:FSR family fosmidomycin resistance protein-like MFS transporter